MSIWTSSLIALLLPMAAAAETLRVAPPDGYCTVPGGGEKMVVLGPCPDGDAAPAVLTVMTGAAGSASALADQAAVARWLGTEAGRAALSRRGRARDVTVLEMRGRGDALLVRLRDPAAMGESWRILVPLADRMVTLTVTAPKGGTLALAEEFLTSMRTANRR